MGWSKICKENVMPRYCGQLICHILNINAMQGIDMLVILSKTWC